MSQKNDENQLNLAIQALKNDPKLKVYTASKIYKVDHRKLPYNLAYSTPLRYKTPWHIVPLRTTASALNISAAYSTPLKYI
jgi:hypothetical protein